MHQSSKSQTGASECWLPHPPESMPGTAISAAFTDEFGRPKGILDGTKPASIADKSFGLQVIWEQILAKVVHAGTLKQLYVSHRRQRKV